MNCLEFRRQLNVDPNCADTEFVQHRQECARCAEAQDRARAFESTLRRALDVPVPAQLAESILLAHATAQHRRRRRYVRGGGLLALAACLVLAFGIGMHLRATPLSTLAVDHVEAPAEHFALSLDKAIDASKVREAFAQRGMTLHDVPDGISYVHCCPVGRYKSVHLVMPEKDGPVTVLYITDDRVAQRSSFEHNGWSGRSVPMGKGTLVLVGHDAASFDHVEQQWRKALATAS